MIIANIAAALGKKKIDLPPIFLPPATRKPVERKDREQMKK
jgi:hypothetical protein